MRLADQIVAASLNGSPLAADFASLAEKIRGAHRFDVDPDAAKVAGFVGGAGLRHLLERRSTLRVPHQTCWLEWLGPSAAYSGGTAELAAGTIRPLRCGFLIETEDGGQRGRISWAWTHPDMGPAISLLCGLFDWSHQPRPVPDIVRTAYEMQGRSWEETVPAEVVRRFPEYTHGLDVVAIAAEERRWGLMPSAYSAKAFALIDEIAKKDARQAMRMADQARRDLEGEPRFVQAILICMSDPGLLHIAPGEDLSRLNKARAKQGRPVLLSFNRVGRSSIPMRVA